MKVLAVFRVSWDAVPFAAVRLKFFCLAFALAAFSFEKVFGCPKTYFQVTYVVVRFVAMKE